MKDLNTCRKEIDEIDVQIMKLFEQRMNVAKDVVTYKLENNLEIFQLDREKEVIKKNTNRLINKELYKYGEVFIQDMMNISKSYQSSFVPLQSIYSLEKPQTQNIIVGFPGVPGSFSEQALETFFDKETKRNSYETFDDVFKALVNDEIQYGVVPIENSSTGVINDTYDAIRNYGFSIVGQQSLSISQHLLGIPGSDIDDIHEVYSHPQGILQTSRFLSQYPHMMTREFVNTATAAKYVADSKDKHLAAIASCHAAKLYGLEILKENIQDIQNNSTRFIVFGKQLETRENASCVSLVLTLNHQIGALYQVMKVINDHQINMLRIESRPLQKTPWEYYFYIDLEGNLENHNLVQAIEEMKTYTNTLRVLGNYIKRS